MYHSFIYYLLTAFYVLGSLKGALGCISEWNRNKISAYIVVGEEYNTQIMHVVKKYMVC